MKTIVGKFKPQASLPQQAIVVLFDLEGFSKFFSQPDIQDYVPKYLNIVMEALDICFNGGEAYWWPGSKQEPKNFDKLPPVIHSKFLGDSVLYIWDYNSFTESQKVSLINRLWTLKSFFKEIVTKAQDEVPVLDIPQKIRFGISAGSVYKLTYVGTNKEEYVGYSINLASRLQSYCREVGIVISGRLNIQTAKLKQHTYLKVVAKNIKGFPREIVIVDRDDYNEMEDKRKKELFEVVVKNLDNG